MVNFLNKILSVLPEAQKIAIKNLIHNRISSGELLSLRSKQEEADLIYSRIKNKIGTILLDPKYVSPDDKISSSDYNQMMEDIFLDLSALYSNINEVASLIKKQSVTLDSEYYKSKAAIEKLLNDVRVFSLRKQNPQFNDIKLIDFNSSLNLSKKQPIANIDPDIRLLQLKPFMNTRVHLTERSSRNTKIYTKTYSQGLKSDLGINFPIENIVDQKPETFWANVVLADSPVSQVYERFTTSNELYQIDVNGPIVEIYFRFSHAEKINTIKICPFSEFPINIIDISYKPNVSSTIYTPISDFTPTTTLDWEEYNFSPVLAQEVKIVISQENYRKVSYLLPKSTVVNTDIFYRILKLRAEKIIGNDVFDSDFSLYTLRTLSSYEDALKSLEDLYKSSGADSLVQPNLEFQETIDNVLNKIYSDISPSELDAFVFSPEALQQPDYVETINVSKYEYLLGLREVEIGYQLFYPVGHYESENYNTQATISEVQIEVDERHTSFKTNWEDDYHKTSTEWEIDIGDNRRIPIHPINIKSNGDEIPSVKDERIEFDLLTNKAYTRLGGYYSTPYKIKKNGTVIPTETWNSIRVTGSIPRLEITLTGSWFDTSSIYTIDYAVDPSSYNIDILSNFNSEPIPTPEIFTVTDSDNAITLSKYPFINYEIINTTGSFIKDENESIWNFIPVQNNVTSGQLFIYPTILDNVGNIIQTGNLTGYIVTGTWGVQSGSNPAYLVNNSNLSTSYFSSIDGISFGYFIKPMDSSVYGELSSFVSSGSFLLKEPLEVTIDQCRRWDSYATGYVFSGQLTGTASGYLTVDYVLGVGVKSDNQIFALSDIKYNPMTITVGGKEAKNITNYETLVHPAFSIANNKDTEYQYIQAGKKIYFNQKIDNQEIRVYYRWITEYLKIIGRLYCNTPINPDLTPKINAIRVFINNLVI